MEAKRDKVFKHGGSQAVRLPVEFRFDGDEVYLSRDPFAGDIVLSKKPRSWREFFALREEAKVLEDFMTERGDDIPQSRKLFEK